MPHVSPIIAGALLASVTFASAVLADGPTQTGMTQLRIADASRPLEGFLWYPTQDTSNPVRAHGNAVWEAIRVVPDAAPADGARPLVVLSHGMYGNARNQAWLAAELTAQGYIVAAVDHPGTSTFSRDPDDARELWERPHDISRTIDHVLAMEDLQIDEDRIYMAGHSLGGWTAMMLAGGRYDTARADGYCEANPDDLVCGIFQMWQVGMAEADRHIITRDWSDPRLSAVAVFDLGGTQTFSDQSLASINTPLIVFGAPIANSGIDLEVESRALIAALPDGTPYIEPADLAHFDFLGRCTEQAHAILMEENPSDVMVCENGGADRAADHAMIAAEVIAFFEAN
ncbi:alpha/beta hydrolase family protein [Jannaschia sp. CCS1]|uniref:alpha/beta hydrolase family protein n=1 Tax=Jannaschia sp. (strain CCS1) TaxID=290400 RepID=UPI000053CBD2|nr:alpha/beta fold hydrolase [Jannaschia sp. CCS1]ABD53650.1 hypothetical protein Jann_0733 [Jannaschia sp. CCS1]